MKETTEERECPIDGCGGLMLNVIEVFSNVLTCNKCELCVITKVNEKE